MRTMGRPLRIDFDGSWHHVMNRGAGRQATFLGDIDRVLIASTTANWHP